SRPQCPNPAACGRFNPRPPLLTGEPPPLQTTVSQVFFRASREHARGSQLRTAPICKEKKKPWKNNCLRGARTSNEKNHHLGFAAVTIAWRQVPTQRSQHQRTV